MKKFVIVHEDRSVIVEADNIILLDGAIRLRKDKVIVAIAPLTALVYLKE